MSMTGILHLVGLAYVVVQVVTLDSFPASSVLILAGGLVQGAALIWLSTKVWNGILIKTTMGVLAFLTFSVGTGIAVVLTGPEPVPASSWIVLLSYTLALLVALSLLGVDHVAARGRITTDDRKALR